MRKRIIGIMSIVCVIVIIIVVGFSFLWNHFDDYSTALNANWGFRLPSKSNYSEVYRKDSGASFTGDGVRYHTFAYKEEQPIKEMFDWRISEGKTIFYSSYQEAAPEWLHSIDVPSEEFPNYSQCLYWYESQNDNSEIIILWDASSKKLYIVESFL